MRKAIRIPMVIFTVFCLLFAIESVAAEGPGATEQGMRYKRMYDPKTVETVTGEVVKVKEITHRRGRSHSVHLLLKTDKEEIPVRLGPAWYLDKQDVKIGEKDKVEVKGSRITFKGKQAIIAAEVKKDAKILKLRDENGIPAWSRRKGQ